MSGLNYFQLFLISNYLLGKKLTGGNWCKICTHASYTGLNNSDVIRAQLFSLTVSHLGETKNENHYRLLWKWIRLWWCFPVFLAKAINLFSGLVSPIAWTKLHGEHTWWTWFIRFSKPRGFERDAPERTCLGCWIWEVRQRAILKCTVEEVYCNQIPAIKLTTLHLIPIGSQCTY